MLPSTLTGSSNQTGSPLPLELDDEIEVSAELRTAPGPRDPDFKIFGLGLEFISKSATSKDGKTRLRCIASSSVRDRHGDLMTEDCVRSMKRQAGGLTIFLNHNYRIPEDVFGSVEAARTRKEDDAVLLELTIVVDESNPRVGKTLESLENGVRMGVSIGALLLDYSFDDPDDYWSAMTINQVELLEASIVGIPANPKSWVDQVMKSLSEKRGIREDLAVRKTIKVGEAGPETVTKGIEFTAAEPFSPADGPEQIIDHYLGELETHSVPRSKAEAFITPGIEGSIAWGIDHGEPSDYAALSAADLVASVMSQYAAPVEEDKSSVAEVEVTAEAEPPDAQETPDASDPGAADDGDADGTEGADDQPEAEAEAQLEALASAGVLASLSTMTDTLKDALTKLVAERNAHAATVAERDLLAEQLRSANDTVKAAVELTKTLMALPRGRKTQMSQIVERSEFAKQLSGSVYSEEVLELLEKGASEQ